MQIKLYMLDCNIEKKQVCEKKGLILKRIIRFK